VQRALTNPEFKEKFLDPNYLQPIVGSPDEFTRYVEADAAKWGKLIREAKIPSNSRRPMAAPGRLSFHTAWTIADFRSGSGQLETLV